MASPFNGISHLQTVIRFHDAITESHTFFNDVTVRRPNYLRSAHMWQTVTLSELSRFPVVLS